MAGLDALGSYEEDCFNGISSAFLFVRFLVGHQDDRSLLKWMQGIYLPVTLPAIASPYPLWEQRRVPGPCQRAAN